MRPVPLMLWSDDELRLLHRRLAWRVYGAVAVALVLLSLWAMWR